MAVLTPGNENIAPKILMMEAVISFAGPAICTTGGWSLNGKIHTRKRYNPCNCQFMSGYPLRSVRPATKIPLGPVLHIYRDRPLRWFDLFVIFIPASLATMAPFLYGLKRDIYARTYYGPVAAQIWSWPWYATATAALIPLLMLAIRRIWQAHRWVALHKNGVNIQWTGGNSYTLRWNQILGLSCTMSETMLFGRSNRIRHNLTLYCIDGHQIQIDDRIKDLPDLSDRIKAKIYPHLLPKMRASYQKGETLFFGPIQIHKQAIHVREQDIPWKQVSRLNIDSGKLIIETSSRFPIRISTGKIPNVELLIQILQEGVSP